jgi:uncharacterized protein (DUF1786 family)
MSLPENPALFIDIGRGTQDILLYTPSQPIENSYKFVLPSPNVVIGNQIENAARKGRPVHLMGPVMGGGRNTQAVKAWLSRGARISATPSAALTIKDNLEVVQNQGVVITEDPPDDAVLIHTGDLMQTELRELFDRFSIPFPEHLAVAVQDHGYSPHMSNRLFRFASLQRTLEERDWNLFGLIDDPPNPAMTRMQAIREQIPGALVMDTGPAAILGALQDPLVKAHAKTGVTIVNVGNGHTLAFTIQEEEVCGVFEHHSGALNSDRLRLFLQKLENGTLTNEEVYNDHGHGAAVHKPMKPTLTAVTGPKRKMLLPEAYQAAPFGDMMLTGCFGLLCAWSKVR